MLLAKCSILRYDDNMKFEEFLGKLKTKDGAALTEEKTKDLKRDFNKLGKLLEKKWQPVREAGWEDKWYEYYIQLFYEKPGSALYYTKEKIKYDERKQGKPGTRKVLIDLDD